MIDYRELLMKYIDHVGRCESVTYTSVLHEWSLKRHMTPEEIEELRRLDKESEKYID